MHFLALPTCFEKIWILFVDILVDVEIGDFISSSGCMGIPNQPPFIANVTSVIDGNLSEKGQCGKWVCR